MNEERKNFQQTLPRKQMAAGAIFLNEAGEVLLVNPTYKEPWETPGGVVEANESPREACIREVKEEIGLEIAPDRLLNVYYREETDSSIEGLIFLFAGRVLQDADIQRIVLPCDELSEFRFVPVQKLGDFLQKISVWRVQKCIEIWDTERTVYLEGAPPLTD